jgi:hypothetical protein
MKTHPKPQCTKDVHWSKVIQYQVIMEPTAGALLSFVRNNAKQRAQQRPPEKSKQTIRITWPFRAEFSLVVCGRRKRLR